MTQVWRNLSFSPSATKVSRTTLNYSLGALLTYNMFLMGLQ